LLLSLANDLEQNYNLNLKTKKMLSLNVKIKNIINNIMKNNFEDLEIIHKNIENIFNLINGIKK